MTERFFEGVKVGDRVWYAISNNYKKVLNVNDDGFTLDCVYLRIDFDGKVINLSSDKNSSDVLKLKYDGMQCVFWKPFGEPQVRPKRKVKKEGWLNIYPKTSSCQLYCTRENADAFADNTIVATVKVEWEEEEL